MFHTIEEFTKTWSQHSDGTKKILAALTDQSLSQRVGPEDRTLGRMAWHLITSIPEMMARTGLKLNGPAAESPLSNFFCELKTAYDILSKSMLEQIGRNWKDSSLQIEDDMYGFKWKRGLTLRILVDHEIHHRGQMTVLMRQAGLKVPGVYGPSRDEWAGMGMPTPEV